MTDPQIIESGKNPLAVKVVRKNDRGGATRLLSPNAPEGAQLEYTPLQWVRPNDGCGPLALWKDPPYEDLEDGMELWEAEYVLCHRSKEVWFRKSSGAVPEIASPEEGTILAWKVRLIRKLDA